jgi:hypothetical protein
MEGSRARGAVYLPRASRILIRSARDRACRCPSGGYIHSVSEPDTRRAFAATWAEGLFRLVICGDRLSPPSRVDTDGVDAPVLSSLSPVWPGAEAVAKISDFCGVEGARGAVAKVHRYAPRLPLWARNAGAVLQRHSLQPAAVGCRPGGPGPDRLCPAPDLTRPFRRRDGRTALAGAAFPAFARSFVHSRPTAICGGVSAFSNGKGSRP